MDNNERKILVDINKNEEMLTIEEEEDTFNIEEFIWSTNNKNILSLSSGIENSVCKNYDLENQKYIQKMKLGNWPGNIISFKNEMNKYLITTDKEIILWDIRENKKNILLRSDNITDIKVNLFYFFFKIHYLRLIFS
jgi:hypothetical protein